METDVTAAEGESEPAAVGRMRTVAHLLDESIRIPVLGVKVGIDPLLGLLPVGGDIAAGVLSLYIVAEAVRLGVSRTTLVRMLLNIAVDVGVGSVPLAGDVFDAFWKANVRNVELAVRDLDGGA